VYGNRLCCSSVLLALFAPLLGNTAILAHEPPASAVPSKDVRGDPCPPLPPLRLAGTTLSDGATASEALIEEADTGHQHLLELDSRFQHYRVSTIEADAVILTGDECIGRMTLALSVDRRRSDVGSLFDALILDPSDSTRVGALRPGSFLGELGLKAGDTIAASRTSCALIAAMLREELSRMDPSRLDSIAVRRDGYTTVFVNPVSTTVRNFRPPPVNRAAAVDGPKAAGVFGDALREREGK
jgi:hypothetical protein